jgi:hypothetical protein
MNTSEEHNASFDKKEREDRKKKNEQTPIYKTAKYVKRNLF